MKANSSRIATIILSCCTLVGIGYQSHSWFKPASVKAQEAEATSGRFQLFVPNTGMWLLVDTATGRTFRVSDNGSNRAELLELAIKSCADADCKTWKGTVAAK
jgi:hypothetical protein